MADYDCDFCVHTQREECPYAYDLTSCEVFEIKAVKAMINDCFGGIDVFREFIDKLEQKNNVYDSDQIGMVVSRLNTVYVYATQTLPSWSIREDSNETLESV